METKHRKWQIHKPVFIEVNESRCFYYFRQEFEIVFLSQK